jgi:Uma2 family endonuclease
MNVAMRKRMTLAEFLDWEERQEPRFEFDGAAPVDRLTGTARHAAIAGNWIVALHPRLRGTQFQVLGSNLKVLTGVRTIRYPDGLVLAGKVDPRATVVETTVVLLEILSEETTRTDRIDKAREYQATPSVRHYVMLEQDAAQAVVYNRAGETWTHDILVADSTLDLPAIDVSFALAELYEGVAFETPEDGEPA